jgi:hypothetical protein
MLLTTADAVTDDDKDQVQEYISWRLTIGERYDTPHYEYKVYKRHYQVPCKPRSHEWGLLLWKQSDAAWGISKFILIVDFMF